MFWLILVLRKRLNVTFERVRFLRLFIFSQNHKYLEAVARGSSVKKAFLEISQIHRKAPVPESFFNKAAGLFFIKMTLWHRCFLVIFMKFPKTTFFYRIPHVAASEYVNAQLLKDVFLSSTFSYFYQCLPRIV